MLASTDVHSGAFSFNSFIATGTDTRTGLYTATLTLPPLCAGALSGPDLPLAVSYSPLNTTDSGFGTGWSLAVSRFAGQHLSLHTGESFRITGSGSEPDIEERRLLTFRFLSDTLDGIAGWRVVHRSGVTEHLRDVSGDGVFLPVRVTSQEGRSVTLDWGQYNGAPFLRTVTDGEGRNLMRAARAGGVMTLTLHPASQKAGITSADAPSVWTLNFSGSTGGQQLDSVDMPGGASSWRFTYETLRGTRCITAVTGPTGAAETIVYGDDGHAFPGGGRPALPRVTRHVVNPGGGQPEMVTRYTYQGGNFLGLGAAGISWRDDGLDNLYRATGPYQYGVTEIREAGDTRSEAERTFNRFHLQTGEKVTRTLTLPAEAGKAAQTVTTVSHTVTQYHADESLPFRSQPAWYQMPDVITQQWYHGDNVGNIRQTTEQSSYDIHGNLTRRRDASGTVTEQEWYPADRETLDADGTLLCPADPQGFTRALAVRRLLPAEERDPALTVRDAAQALETRFRYALLPSAEGGDGDWLAESAVTLSALAADDKGGVRAPTLLKTTVRRWVNNPSDLTRHGLPLEVVETPAGQEDDTGSVTAYAYERVTHGALPVLRTTTRRFSRTTQKQEPAADAVAVSITDSLLSHGEPLRAWPDGQVEVQYTYDALGRLTEEVVAPGGSFAATRSYAYGVNAADGLTWTERRRAEDGAVSRTWYDGLGRVVRDERQDADAPDKRFRDVASVSWDGLGRESATNLTDWEGNKDVVMATRVTYDVWGERHRVTAPDGTVSVTVASPVTLTQETWSESADGSVKRGRVRTVSDESGNPVSVTPLSADGETALPGRTWRYDGHGQVTLTTDESGNETRNAYDALGRPTVTMLPDDTRVTTTYAPQSAAALVAALTVEANSRAATAEEKAARPALALRDVAPRASGSVRALGLVSQTFDGLERPVSVTAGSLTETLAYDGASARVKTLTRPSRRALRYTYAPDLTDAPQSVSGEDTDGADFTYHPKTALLTKSVTRGDAATLRDYARDGRGNLTRMTRADGDAETVTILSYSREGLLLTRRSGSGPEEVHVWEQGRPVSITAGGMSERYTYDAAGALEKSVRRAGDETVTVNCTYDDRGREEQRVVSTAQGEVTFRLTWHDDGRLATRTRSEDGTEVLKETFGYDPRGRLEDWRCTGADASRLPQTPYGQPMVRQLLMYDALDNVELCRTTFLVEGKEERNDAWFSYDATDADRLVSLSHDHPLWALPAGRAVTRGGVQASEVTFGYDADGNMTNDECGRTLGYDAQGRLVTVSDAGGELMRYRYDGSGHLAGVWTSDEADEELREWDGYRLAASRRADRAVHYLHGNEAVGEEHRNAGEVTRRRLFVTDAAGSITGEQESGSVRQAAYGAYGTRAEGELETVLGFNGEVRERGPGWYLLGNGYRVYNPVLMRFHSPDSESPLGAGGLNRYVYGLGDPVNIHDPSGNIGEWLSALAWVGAALGTAALAVSIVGLPASLGVLATAAGAAVSSSTAAAATAAGITATTVAAAAVDVTAITLGAASLTTGMLSLSQTIKNTGTNKTLDQVSLYTGIGAFFFGGATAVLNKGVTAAAVRNPWKALKDAKKNPAVELVDDAAGAAPATTATEIHERFTYVIKDRFKRPNQSAQPTATQSAPASPAPQVRTAAVTAPTSAPTPPPMPSSPAPAVASTSRAAAKPAPKTEIKVAADNTMTELTEFMKRVNMNKSGNGVKDILPAMENTQKDLGLNIVRKMKGPRLGD